MKQEVQKRIYRRFKKNEEIQIMEKTMYWADIEDAKLTESYLIPRTTLLGWKEKRGNPTDWRSIVLDRLSLLAELQDRTTEKIKAIFKKEELMAIWGSLKSTPTHKEIIKNPDYLAFSFADYCIYEETEASKFCNTDTKKMSEVVCKKLKNLSEFERFALLEYMRSEKGKKEIFKEEI